MTLGELGTQYAEEYKAYKEKRTKLEKRKERIDKQLEALTMPHWIDDVVKPIGEALVKSLSDRHYEIIGPFGLDCEVCLWFVRDGVEDREKLKGDNTIGLSFRPDHTSPVHAGIINYSVDTGQFAPGTIGCMNRMNHPTVALDPDAEIESLMQYVK